MKKTIRPPRSFPCGHLIFRNAFAVTIGESISITIGGGGGGRNNSGHGGKGGSGIVVVTYELPTGGPTITSDGGGTTAAKNVAENTLYVTTVAADVGNAALLLAPFSLDGGADAAHFDMDGETGVLSVANPGTIMIFR